MDYIFIKICVISAVSGWCYVDVLTINRGLFDWIPKYYQEGSFLEKVLRCSRCASGWLSLFFTAYIFFSQLGAFSFTPYLYTLFAPIFTMAIVNIIKSK